MLEQECKEKQNITKSKRKLQKCVKELACQFDEERKRGDQYWVRLVRDNNHSKELEKQMNQKENVLEWKLPKEKFKVN